MTRHLYQCSTDDERTGWAVARLKAGRTIDDVTLWTAGVDRPMRLVASVKSELRSQGILVSKALRKVRDAAGDLHDVLTWFVAPTTSITGDTQ